jgi:predicted O-methyltransferase YrrM
MNKSLIEYAEKYSDTESELLKELSRETNLRIYNPRMLSGHLQGRILSMLSHMIKPKYILEIGTYTGYSALCLAEGLQPDGVLHTIENNDELEDFIKNYFNRCKYKKNIVLHIGDARKIIPTLNITFDLVYIDGNKKEYIEYFNLVINKVNSGGFIFADNVFWNGKVIDEHEQDEFTNTIRNFNKMIHENQKLEKVIIPIRDGLSIIRKK